MNLSRNGDRSIYVNKSVLDASAFLAYLRDETGAEIVENALINGCYRFLG